MIQVLQVPHDLSYSIVFVKSMSTMYLDAGSQAALKEGYDRGWDSRRQSGATPPSLCPPVGISHFTPCPMSHVPCPMSYVPLTRLKSLVNDLDSNSTTLTWCPLQTNLANRKDGLAPQTFLRGL